MDEILNFFPEEMKQKIKQNLLEDLEEIRIRTNKPIILRNGQAEKQISCNARYCATDFTKDL